MTSSLAGRILVVDDHDLNLKLLQRLLELDGHRVTAVSTLSAAERAIAQEVPELVVLDLNLPDGDGLGLARKIKSDPRTARCAILACTAGAMKGDRDRALEAGCDAYVSKPIDTREFGSLAGSLVAAAPR
jgi:two-component system cell cycle response regulator